MQSSLITNCRSIKLRSQYHIVAPQNAAIPTPDSTLINGKGRYAGGPTAPLSIINVRRNRRYRMRLVSLSCDPNWTFSIDDHTMTIIEVDAVNVEPLTGMKRFIYWVSPQLTCSRILAVDSIQIFAGKLSFLGRNHFRSCETLGQRYSFVLHANQPVNNYWIRANPNLGTTGK